MSSVSSIDSYTTSAASTTAKEDLSLSTQDFLDIMITELTNQDPFEPMKNQDLLNQMSAIQQINSSQSMATSFETLMENFDAMLTRQDINSASAMVGQIVSGTNTSGASAYGKVVGVTVSGNNVLLGLDTGETMNLTDVEQFGGTNSQDIIGKVVMAKSANTGEILVGKVESVQIEEDAVYLKLEGKDDSVVLSQASILNIDNADLLMGRKVTSVEGVSGTVVGVTLLGDDQVQFSVETTITSDGETQTQVKQINLEDLGTIG